MPVAFRDVQYGTGAVGHRRQRLAKRPVGLRRRLRQWVRISTGRPAEEADDVWSLCVVLDEMVAGRHPFAGGDLEQVRHRIRRQRLVADDPDASTAPTAATTVAAFAASILTAPRARRPGTAPAFAAALAAVSGNA